jgi:hypothetical protein
MKKVLVYSYESGSVFVKCPRGTRRKRIYQAVREYAQDRLNRPVFSLSNYTYETRSEWGTRAAKEILRPENIPVITL